MTDAEANQPVTRGDAVLLTTAVDNLGRKFKWQVRLTAGLVTAFVLVVVALGLGTEALVRLRSESRCVEVLAAASADRTGVLAPLSKDRQDAADARQDAESALILTLLPSAGESQSDRAASFGRALQVFHSAADTYTAANRTYQQAYAANPPPSTPNFHC